MNGAPAGSGILLYTAGWCPFCMRAKALLERKGLEYREINERRRSAVARRDDPALGPAHGAADIHW